MGSIITNKLTVWYQINNYPGTTCNFNESSPFWNNNLILSGFMPFTFPHDLSKVVKVIFNMQGLLSFQDLKVIFSPWFFLFFVLYIYIFLFYLRLRTALKSYVVPWDTKTNSQSLLNSLSCPVVSSLYDRLVTHNIKHLLVMEKDLQRAGFERDWTTIWGNIFTSCKRLAHQLIHFKFTQRFYFTQSQGSKWSLWIVIYVIHVPNLKWAIKCKCFGAVYRSSLVGFMLLLF
jgi:hypothetical protein